jgi:putative cell wall-binding protein
VLTSAANFPDALAGGALAAHHDAPVLLTPRDSLPPRVETELERLGAQTVYLLGGAGAVSDGVRERLEQLGMRVERIAGAQRFETAARIAAQVGVPADGEVLLALGRHAEEDRAWPDAVAATALLATDDPPPTLLTERDGLPAATREALRSLDAQRVTIVGGTAAISEAVVDELRAMGFGDSQIRRLGGDTRWATSMLLAAEAQTRLGRTPARLIFATGQRFPDALSAGGVAARVSSPVVLVPDCDLDVQVPAIRRFVRDSGVARGTVIGGPSAISEKVRWQLGEDIRR